ncbi:MULTISPECIES: hypothetical protein [Bradyrhizobium]|jgi:hypothetical protein|uniref:Uncharacterized protein n=1 Tax=Bradyrhizobium lablabi TaxID=722472 RepID=A0A1H4TZ02_9BRAD|nr:MULTISPECIES: hypothetical protein [Bradyrhizobium]SEC61234.1 hypothetical protein SAMN05444171_1850 [Bradyrhizobium lablabi]
MRAAPAVSRAMCIKECCTRAYRFSGEHPAFPAQWLYGLYEIVLVTGFLATIISFSFRFRQLDASTGASDPNDFAVRKCRARQSLPHVHRSPPLVRDDGQRPLCRQKLAECANGRLKQNRPLLELSP